MRTFEKEQLVSSLQFTAKHVARVNELLAQYHRIHRIPYNILTTVLATVALLLLFSAIGLTNAVHTVGERVATSIVTLEKPAASVVEQGDDSTAIEGEGATEEDPFIDLSFITSIFLPQTDYSKSGVFRYALVVALFDTIFIIGLAIGLTYGLFYLYHVLRVKKHKEKLHSIVKDIKQGLEELEHSIIPQEYWHVPYLQRMQRFVEQDRADNLRECLELIDLEIRHKQIIDALAYEQPIDAKLLSESIIQPSSKVGRISKKAEGINSTNLSN